MFPGAYVAFGTHLLRLTPLKLGVDLRKGILGAESVLESIA